MHTTNIHIYIYTIRHNKLGRSFLLSGVRRYSERSACFLNLIPLSSYILTHMNIIVGTLYTYAYTNTVHERSVRVCIYIYYYCIRIPTALYIIICVKYVVRVVLSSSSSRSSSLGSLSRRTRTVSTKYIIYYNNNIYTCIHAHACIYQSIYKYFIVFRYSP